MKRIIPNRLKKLFIRILLYVCAFTILLWLSIPWISQIPVVKTWIESYLSNTLGYTISIHSMGLGLLGDTNASSLTLTDENGSLHADVGEVSLNSPLSSNPFTRLSNISTSLSGQQIFSASHASFLWQKGWNLNHIQSKISEGRINIPVLFDLPQNRDKDKSTPLNIPHTSSIEFDRIHLHWPNVLNDNSLSGSIETDAKDATATGRFQFHKGQGLIKLNTTIDIEKQTIEHADIHISKLPISYQSPIAISGILNGTASIHQENKGYSFAANLTTYDLAFPPIALHNIHLPTASLHLQGQLNLDYQPLQVSSRLVHAQGTYQYSNLGEFVIPDGTMHITMDHEEERMESHWELADFAHIHIQSSTNTWSKNIPYEISTHLKSVSLSEILNYVPQSLQTELKHIDGFISLQGGLQRHAGDISHVTADFSITEGTYKSEQISLANLKISGNVKGGLNEGIVFYDASTDLQINATEERQLGTSIDSIQGNINYRINPMDFSITIDQAESDIIQSIHARYTSNGQWDFTGTLPLDTQIQRLWNVIFPESEREMFGMGSLDIRLDGDSSTVRFEANSPDITAYSFSHDPAFGFQLRKLNWQGKLNLNPSLTYTSTLSAATPYISFKGNDCEWPGQEISLSLRSPTQNHSSYQFDMIPPGGGSIEGKLNNDGSIQVNISKINMESFVLPVVARFGFGLENKDKLWGITASGLLSGKIDYLSSNNGLMLNGDAELMQSDITYSATPWIKIKNASLNTPFSYPIKYKTLPRHALEFSADTITVDENALNNIDFTIPIAAKRIAAPTEFSIPVFGGEIKFQSLELTDWDSPTPSLNSRIHFNQLDVMKLSQSLPLLPQRGTLNGQLGSITFSKDLFQLKGELEIHIFDGRMILHDIFIKDPFADYKRIGVDVELEHLDLKPFSSYFNLGVITGRLSGKMKDVQIEIPPADSGELIKPVRFDIEVKSDSLEEETISYDTLMLIMKLGQNDVPAEGFVKRKNYNYSGLGLRAILQDDEMQLRGTLKNEYLIGHTKNKMSLFGFDIYFSDTVGVRFPDSKKRLDFDDFWLNLLNMTKRLSSD